MSGHARAFVPAFLLVVAAKTVLAAHLPLFGDEAWYWLESRHLAWAYSDVPGLTAWMIRAGTALGGDTWLGVRWPFLAMASALPWLVRAIARHAFGDVAGWQAAWAALAFPLLGALGVLALPDVPLTFAAALCLLAAVRMHAAPSVAWRDAACLALGLAIGASSHYRFALLIVAGALGLLLDASGRRVLHSPRTWLALAVGAAAWLPLLAWNLAHGHAGLAFQFAERHPWSPHAGGLWFVPVQLAIASPLLFVACVLGAALAWRRWRARAAGPWALVLGTALVPIAVYGVLAFVADRERTSFHWTLQAYLPLLCVAPLAMAGWPRALRIAAFALAFAALAGLLAFAASGAVPAWRAALADGRWYPDNFAGWQEIAEATRGLDDLAADNFMLGAQLAFARGDAGLPILDHPLNRKHGRAAQLALWGQGQARSPARWLVLEDTAVPMRQRLAHYHALCARHGDLPIERIIDVDHGRKRFLLLDLDRRGAVCRAPALAWIDVPAARARVGRRFEVAGWAFKDGAGVARVDVTLDGRVVAQADYGLARPHVAAYWKHSRDPAHPAVGFTARVDASGFDAGDHWLGLVLHGRDGSVERWPQQRVRLD